jgi:hypothetical protein
MINLRISGLLLIFLISGCSAAEQSIAVGNITIVASEENGTITLRGQEILTFSFLGDKYSAAEGEYVSHQIMFRNSPPSGEAENIWPESPTTVYIGNFTLNGAVVNITGQQHKTFDYVIINSTKEFTSDAVKANGWHEITFSLPSQSYAV